MIISRINELLAQMKSRSTSSSSSSTTESLLDMIRNFKETHQQSLVSDDIRSRSVSTISPLSSIMENLKTLVESTKK
jgi:hypothetical protein